jgi:hypothetical protein
MIVVMVLAASACGSESKSGESKAPKRKAIPENAGRATATVCQAERGPGKIDQGARGECKEDGECTKGKNGRCLTVGARERDNKCTYDQCITDADCSGSNAGPCECNPYGNTCAVGNCKVNSDCGPEGHCMPSSDMGCSQREIEYHCVTNDDTCTPFGEDCGKDHQCIYSDELKHFTCAEEPKCPMG